MDVLKYLWVLREHVVIKNPFFRWVQKVLNIQKHIAQNAQSFQGIQLITARALQRGQTASRSTSLIKVVAAAGHVPRGYVSSLPSDLEPSSSDSRWPAL